MFIWEISTPLHTYHTKPSKSIIQLSSSVVRLDPVQYCYAPLTSIVVTGKVSIILRIVCIFGNIELFVPFKAVLNVLGASEVFFQYVYNNYKNVTILIYSKGLLS